MKNTLGWRGWGALLVMPALVARADDAASKPAPVATLHASAPAISPTTTSLSALPTPPDGIEFSTGEPEAIAERTLEIKAEQRSAAAQPAFETDDEQRQTASDDDWMLRDYTARLKKEGLAQTAATDPSTFFQSSNSSTTSTEAANADPLLSPLDSPNPDKTTPPLPTNPNSKSEIGLTKLPALTSLQPLLPPLNSPELNAPRDAWGSEPVSTATTDMAPPLPVTGDNPRTSSSLDVPGLTAAESGLGPAPSDLSFQDPLPDKPASRSRQLEGENTFLAPTVPASDVSEFFKKQALALQAPTAPTVVQPLTLPARPVSYTQPEQLAKPVISGLRSHVDDPFDILKQ